MAVNHKKHICVDFDGVIHSYTSGWQGAYEISDPPVDGAIEWLESLIESDDFKPMIYSSRSIDENGIKAMKLWFSKHGLSAKALSALEFPTKKPPAWLTIDDRAIQFQGVFPSQHEMRNFKAWNKK
jgi:hypothetical protein